MIWEIAKISIFEGIDDYINTWCSKKRPSKNYLLQWKTTLSTYIDIKIDKLEKRLTSQKTDTNLLRNHQIRITLAELHKDFIFVPAEKASSNICITYEKFCV